MREGTNPRDVVVTGSELSAVRDAETRSASVSKVSGEGLSLRQILPACRFLGADDLHFGSIAESPQSAEPGQLVVHLSGRDCPTKLIAEAMARGAAGILTEQVLPCPLPQCIVGDIDLALARITACERNRPDRQLLNVAVVGSAGKTSTTLLIASLLRASGIRTSYQCDLGDCDGVVQSTPSSQLPSGAELIDWLGDSVENHCKASVIEICEERARHGHYDAIEFDVVVVAGAANCDGDFGPSALQCILDRMTNSGVVIAPVDDKRAMRVIRDTGARLVTYGIRKAADVSAKIIDQSGGMTTLLVSYRDTTAVMETSLCGPAMAANHAAAALLGLLLDQPLQEVVERLGQLRVIPGRGERLVSQHSATVVLETGGSPERIDAALRTHRSMKSPGKLWCVMAVDETMCAEELSQFGTLMERYADVSIVTSTPANKRGFLPTSHHVLDGVQRVASLRLVADRERACLWALGEAGPRDTIVLFTNERGQTAQQQRLDLELLTNSVEQHRSRAPVAATPSIGIAKAPFRLSIFG